MALTVAYFEGASAVFGSSMEVCSHSLKGKGQSGSYGYLLFFEALRRKYGRSRMLASKFGISEWILPRTYS